MELAFNELSKRFGPTKALDGVSASLNGKVCMLLGPNGSGKTTLMTCLCGLTFPDAGWLEVDGKRYDATNAREWRNGTAEIRKKSGFSGDKSGLPKAFSGEDLLRWSVKMAAKKPDPRWIARITEQLEIGTYLARTLSGYSSGMLQKIAIAASLVGDPEVVFWDEPTSNLDARARSRVAALMKEMSQRGTTFILASHSPAEFEGLVDWIGVLVAGRFVSAGNLPDLSQESDEFEALTTNPKLLGSKIIELGIGKDLAVMNDHVTFTLSSRNEGPVASEADLSKVTGCPVKSLRRLPPSIYKLYNRSLESEEAHV